MKQLLSGVTVVLGVAALLAGCTGNSGACVHDAGALRAAVASADAMDLFEGLPHQMFERERLEHEKQTKPTTTLDNFPFYAASLKLSDADEAWIRAWIASDANLAAFSGEKKCGGFHPDYCAAWGVDGQIVRSHFCFGCGEILFARGRETVRLDMTAAAATALRSRLDAYRKNRPPFSPHGRPATTSRPPDSLPSTP
ncbi:MAG: hypothetical protein ACKVS9_10360 [Phycisphaerae bacterium]